MPGSVSKPLPTISAYNKRRIIKGLLTMKFIPGYVAVLIGIVAQLAAPVARASADWTDYVDVIELIPTGRHYYEVQLDIKENPSVCREKDWFYLNYEARGANKMFDLLVDNIKSELRLRVYVTGICNLKGYSEISAVSASAN
jgi:hypothetical protein